MAVAIFTVFLVGFILGGSTVYLVENHFRTKEMNKIYKLTESLINGNDLDDSDIGKETLYSKTANQLIRLQEMLEGRRKEAEKSQYEIQKLISEIAHQLRTPLANIKNYTELLQESLDETQEVLNTEYMKDLRTSEEQLYKNCSIRARNHTSSHAKRKSCRNNSKCIRANTKKGRR